MRTSARQAVDRILEAAHIDDEGQLTGQARRTLRWLADRYGPEQQTIDGIVELVDAARRIGELEGLADHDNSRGP
jgi:hypothetical protein